MTDLDPKDFHCIIPCPIFSDETLQISAKVLLGGIWGLYFKRKNQPLTYTNKQLHVLFKIGFSTIVRELANLQQRGLILIEDGKGKNRTITPNLDYSWDYAEYDRVLAEVELMNEEYEFQKIKPEILAVINYWNNKGLMKVKLVEKDGLYEMKPGVKDVVKQLELLFKGTLFNAFKSYRYHHNRPWTAEEIEESIDNFHLAATSDKYYPADKKLLTGRNLSKFLLNTFTNNPKWLSLLIHYTNPPQSNSLPVTKEEPKSLPMVMELRQGIMEGYLFNRPLDKIQEIKLIAVANRFVEWREAANKYSPSPLTPTQWANYILEFGLELIQSKGQHQYDPLDTMRHKWFWDSFTRFMLKKGLLRNYRQ